MGQARFERRPTIVSCLVGDVVLAVVGRRGEAPLVPPYFTCSLRHGITVRLTRDTRLRRSFAMLGQSRRLYHLFLKNEFESLIVGSLNEVLLDVHRLLRGGPDQPHSNEFLKMFVIEVWLIAGRNGL